jgi:hypothetical protein
VAVAIPLTRGYVTVVDEDDAEFVSRWNWEPSVSMGRRRTVYALRRGPRPERPTILLHRAILCAGPDEFVDHINGNGLDNRRANLRLCSRSDNQCNRGPAKGRRFKGVAPHGDRYKVAIRRHGVFYHLGVFDTEVEAAIAYNEAAIVLHGAFAHLNSIPSTAPETER